MSTTLKFPSALSPITDFSVTAAWTTIGKIGYRPSDSQRLPRMPSPCRGLFLGGQKASGAGQGLTRSLQHIRQIPRYLHCKQTAANATDSCLLMNKNTRLAASIWLLQPPSNSDDTPSKDAPSSSSPESIWKQYLLILLFLCVLLPSSAPPGQPQSRC